MKYRVVVKLNQDYEAELFYSVFFGYIAQDVLHNDATLYLCSDLEQRKDKSGINISSAYRYSKRKGIYIRYKEKITLKFKEDEKILVLDNFNFIKEVSATSTVEYTSGIKTDYNANIVKLIPLLVKYNEEAPAPTLVKKAYDPKMDLLLNNYGDQYWLFNLWAKAFNILVELNDYVIDKLSPTFLQDMSDLLRMLMILHLRHISGIKSRLKEASPKEQILMFLNYNFGANGIMFFENTLLSGDDVTIFAYNVVMYMLGIKFGVDDTLSAITNETTKEEFVVNGKTLYLSFLTCTDKGVSPILDQLIYSTSYRLTNLILVFNNYDVPIIINAKAYQGNQEHLYLVVTKIVGELNRQGKLNHLQLM